LEESRPVDFAALAGPTNAVRPGAPYIAVAVEAPTVDRMTLDALWSVHERTLAGAPVLVITDDHSPSPRAELEVASRGGLLLRSAAWAVDANLAENVLRRFVSTAVQCERRTLGLRGMLFEVSEGALTPAELRVAELTALDHSTEEIAAALSISPRTVSNHITNALSKCGARGLGPRWFRQQAQRSSVGERGRVRHEQNDPPKNGRRRP
jgi:DNA-binding CsgD family transcriptional regulator